MLAIRPLPSAEPLNGPGSSQHSSRLNAHDDIDPKTVRNQMKFPRLTGRADSAAILEAANPTNPAFKKYNDEGDARPAAPYRSADCIIDPVSGFVSVAGDINRDTGHSHIPSMVTLTFTPQSYDPRQNNSIRMAPSAPPQLRRQSDRDPGNPYDWSSRHVSDSKLRSMLGGWTSEKAEKPKSSEGTKDLRDSLALQFMYTSSTQRAYNEIQWDKNIAERRWPPTTTYEKKPDPVSLSLNHKQSHAPASDWETSTKTWDRAQLRTCYYKPKYPIPGVSYMSHYPRAQQIPNYSGIIGGENILEIDNPEQSFEPFTLKRSNVPRPTDTAHRPDIPRYTGSTLYRPPNYNKPMNSEPTTDYPIPMTAHFHRSFAPVPPNTSQFKKMSQMSRMVTTVPPSNPFNRIDKDQLEFGDKSEKTDIGQSRTVHPHAQQKV